MSRTRRVFFSFAWNGGTQVLTVLTQLGTVPLFIRAWGNELYGDWLALSAVVAYLSMADAGMQTFVINRLTQFEAQHKWDELRRDLASATAMYAIAVGVAVAAVLGMCSALPFERWFEGRQTASAAPAITLLLGLQVAVSLAVGFVVGLYRVLGRTDLWQFVAFAHRALALAATLAVLLSGGGARTLAAAQLAVGALVGLVALVDVSRRDGRLRPRLQGAQRAAALGFLGPSLLFLVVGMAFGLTIQGTVLVLSSTLGAVAVVVFSTTRAVANVVRQFVGMLMSTAWPELTRLGANGDRARFALGHRLCVKLAAGVAVPAAAWLFFAGPDLYRLWTGGRTVPDVALMRLLLLDQMASTPWFASSNLLAATNRHRALSGLYAATSVVSLGLIVLLVPRYGVSAVGWVTLLVNLGSFAVLVPRWAQQSTGEPLWAYWRGVYGPVAVLVAGCLAAAGLAQLAAPGGLAGVMAAFFAVCLAGVAIGWTLLFSADERRELAAAVSGALARRRVQPELQP